MRRQRSSLGRSPFQFIPFQSMSFAKAAALVGRDEFSCFDETWHCDNVRFACFAFSLCWL
jgi:hypothetical protein